MEDIVPGQRWISNTESELGLGLISEVDSKRISVLYLATGAKRLYARNNAPLTRVKFAVGDTIETEDSRRLTVTRIHEKNGLIDYFSETAAGEEVRVDERELNHHIQFNKPQDRLFTGQFDPSRWFALRYQTWLRRQRWQQSPVKGLIGARTVLIPHQLYIAHQAAQRIEPRIMLADEVGLGKTIEAGLIIHQRLLNGLSQRVLILVPETLIHQWLVELIRRFNLAFSVFDEERCSASHEANPFALEQSVIASMEFFRQHPQRRQEALEACWDLVVVDEAHHLKWHSHAPDADYLFVEQLALTVPGLVLLTATPEQLGQESHFSRLRLLDPDRFHHLEHFLDEQRQFQPIAAIADKLLVNARLTDNEEELLKQRLRRPELPVQANERTQLVDELLDHHGTGRILFRNSRQTVQGFPARACHFYALEKHPDAEQIEDDPYRTWLLGLLKTLHPEKALLICQHATTVIQLEQWLKNRCGIATAVFHEGMSIVERDRAAAYFADEESNARLLICSEIGSEGRNFQFLHHLILFDLPENPDLLQQRIGRLDRIGQRQTIQIHIPYIRDSAHEVWLRFYHDGMNAFQRNLSCAAQLLQQMLPQLQQVLNDSTETTVEALVLQTRALRERLEQQMQQGRDKLLELNSCRPQPAALLVEQVQQHERDSELWPYLENMFDCYGVDTEFHSNDCYILWPSESLRIAHFPMLKDDGLTVTVNREIALAREDIQFLSDDHPMVTAAMDLVLSSETGNCAVSVIKHPECKAGQFLLELVFIIETSAPASLQLERFLPATPIHIIIDQHKNLLTDTLDHASLQDSGDRFDSMKIAAFLHNQRSFIQNLIALAEHDANARGEVLLAEAEQLMQNALSDEINRLISLKKINPNIRDEEIEQLHQRLLQSRDQMRASRVRLDAVRFIICS